MSWTISTGLLSKGNAEKGIDRLELDAGDGDSPSTYSAATLDQFQTAKNAAKELIKGMPGPYVTVSLSGHANGVGFQKSPGMSNDFISIGVAQQCSEDVGRYKSIDGKSIPTAPEPLPDGGAIPEPEPFFT
jgi:hypothetical protein